jgi:hypothetical protein
MRERGRGAGDEEREPGGEKVEAYRAAADGAERRSRMGRVTSDWESGVPCMEAIRVFWTLKAADDAAMGGAEMGSVGESWSKLDAMTLLGHLAMLASAVAQDEAEEAMGWAPRRKGGIRYRRVGWVEGGL